MRVGNFSLMIPEGKERDSGHVELPHGTPYRIKMMNHCYSKRCDALVTVDGKELSLFRINRGDSITLETYPGGDHGRFTFFQADSAEADAAGASGIAKDVRGLIQVTFKPEKEIPKQVQRVNSIRRSAGGPCGQSVGGTVPDWGGEPMRLCSAAPQNTSAGVTGLTGHSSQTFHEVANLNYDPAEEVTISIRLVCGPAVRPLEAVRKGNPVPEAVG